MTSGGRIAILCGHYGTGKSECSIALARTLPAPVTLIDLDVVNPYFRSREARAVLEADGIAVIGNSLGIDTGVDLPAIPGSIVPALRDQQRRVVIDLGGDPVGARAIRQFRPRIPTEDTDLLYVVNAFRPGNRDSDTTVASIREIEQSVGLKCTGLINNSHLLGETTVDHVMSGDRLCREVFDATGLPVVWVAARPPVLDACRDAALQPAGMPLPVTGVLRQDWMDSRR